MIRRALSLLCATLGTLLAVPVTAAAAAPDPVIIVNGTFGPEFFYEPLAARLRHDGHRVFIFQLTNLGTGDIALTSRDLGAFVAGVRTTTGAARVDLVGHSQGGLVARHYVKFLGGSSTVDSLVSLGSPHYGTAIANLAAFFGAGNCIGIVACQQMAVGSEFLADLNAGDDTIGSVRYTNLYTLYDELVRPIANATLRDGATNVLVQSQCPLRVVDHLGLALDGTVYDGIHDALRGAPVSLNCWAV
ncbi:MAG TPA: alpha/beta hydrolase [Actinophytocola sp.]|uniref:lipase family alpha/beta hydrolase n=1 Tax=Actinophytocola sp. TaxID=1872138 RepID=UPI002DDD164C|nr:alpha/beta hydrolase [Actinophytocola sp.]HEV2781282.1 alpha/beta hydrolase [Actinophytocola sp.]